MESRFRFQQPRSPSPPNNEAADDSDKWHCTDKATVSRPVMIELIDPPSSVGQTQKSGSSFIQRVRPNESDAGVERCFSSYQESAESEIPSTTSQRRSRPVSPLSGPFRKRGLDKMKSCKRDVPRAEEWSTDLPCDADTSGNLSFWSRPPSSYGDSCPDWSDRGAIAENSDSRDVCSLPCSVLSAHWHLRQSLKESSEERDGEETIPESTTRRGSASPAEATTTSSVPPLPPSAWEEDEPQKTADPRLEERAPSRGRKSSTTKRCSASRSSASASEGVSAVPHCTSPTCSKKLPECLAKKVPELRGENVITRDHESLSSRQNFEGKPSTFSGAPNQPSLTRFEDDSQLFSDELQRSLAHVCRTAELTFFNTTASMQRRMAEQFRFEQQQHERMLRESRAEVEAARAELVGMRSAKEATEDQLLRVFAYVRRRLLRQQVRERREAAFKAWRTFAEREKARRRLTGLVEAQRVHRMLQRAFHPWRHQSFRASVERMKQRATQAAQEAAEHQIAALQSERRKETQMLIETRQKLRLEAFQRQQLQKTLQILFLQGATAVCAPMNGDSKSIAGIQLSENTPYLGDVHPSAHNQNYRICEGSTADAPGVSSARIPLSLGEMKSSFLSPADISTAARAADPFPGIGLADFPGRYLPANGPALAGAVGSNPPLSHQHQPGRDECVRGHSSTPIGTPSSPIANMRAPYSTAVHPIGAHRSIPTMETAQQRQSCIGPLTAREIQPSGDCNLAVVGRTVRSTPRLDAHLPNLPACHLSSEHIPDSEEGKTQIGLGHQLPFLTSPPFTSQGVKTQLQQVITHNRGQTLRAAAFGSDEVKQVDNQAPRPAPGSENQPRRVTPPTQYWVPDNAVRRMGVSAMSRDAGTCEQGTRSDRLGINNPINASPLEPQMTGTPPLRESSGRFSWVIQDRTHRYKGREGECVGLSTRTRSAFMPANINKNRAPRTGRISPSVAENLTSAPPVASYFSESSDFVMPFQATFGSRAASLGNRKIQKSTVIAGKECRVKSSLWSKKQTNWTRSITAGS
nr:TPA: hypothetical protein BN1204_061480 [Neospora caninum Liverpool]